MRGELWFLGVGVDHKAMKRFANSFSQRLGLEWVADNIQYFGGNPDCITLGGPSAGSYSTQFQLCHEFNFSAKPLIKRVIQYSNAVGMQPKSVEESQAAFDGLLAALDIPLSLSAEDKMRRLRATDMQTLIDITMRL
jgi:carboxylesterase type B